MAATVYSKNLLLDFLFRNNGSAPTAWYVGLLVGDEEVSGTGYSRVEVTFLAPIAGVVRNDSDLSFGPGNEDWGAVTGFAVYDETSPGNILAQGTLTTFTPDGDNDIIIEAGELEISVE